MKTSRKKSLNYIKKSLTDSIEIIELSGRIMKRFGNQSMHTELISPSTVEGVYHHQRQGSARKSLTGEFLAVGLGINHISRLESIVLRIVPLQQWKDLITSLLISSGEKSCVSDVEHSMRTVRLTCVISNIS